MMFRRTPIACAVQAALGLTAVAVVPLTVRAEEPTTEETIVVTGSRIEKANTVSSSPVTQINSDELVYTGNVRVEDMVRNLPSVYAEQSAGTSNGSVGTATINLRNLGAQRTMVLINGRRMPIGSPDQGGDGNDLNQIPGALIERVEVLTGGASSVYGSDAVAGVVNFIMKKDFEGVSFDYQYGQYMHENDNGTMSRLLNAADQPNADSSVHDGDLSSYSVIIGGNLEDGRGNITVYATYRDIQKVLQSQRDYSACALGSAAIADGCQGSPNFNVFSDFATYAYKQQGNQFVNSTALDEVANPADLYNYGPLNYYQRPDTRYTAGAFAHYDFSDQVQTYAEFMFMDEQTVAQIAPSGDFLGLTSQLNCGNPLMSDQQKTAIGCSAEDITDDAHKTVFIGRRNVEGGGRQDDLRLTDFRGVWGFKGDINDTWRYDVYGQYSEVEMQDTFKNDFSITKLARALDVIDVDGVPTCRSGPPCVPWNIFTDGGVTQAALDYLALPAFIRSTTRQKIVDGYVGAHLGDYGLTVPWAKNGVEFIAGAEYRKENLDFSPDSNFSSGDGAGSTFKLPVHGNYDVSEVFTEVSIPLIEGVKWIDALEADLGYRYSDYSTGNETNTYKAAGTWNVMSGLMFRSSFQRAVRAANIRELFLPQTFNLFDMDADPCAFATLGAQPLTTPSPAGYTFAQCALTGVTAADWGFVSSNPAGQYNYVQGGNERLKPEESDTKSYGVVYSPSFVEKLTVSADYYDITIDKAISNVDPQTILLQCLAGNLGLCGDVHRGAVSSNLWLGNDTTNPNTGFITALNVNIGSYHTQGWDITADYGFDVGSLGSVSLQDTLGLITLWEQQELRGLPIESCKGKWGVACGSPLPDTRNVLRATWTTPWSITLTTAWRYISQVDDKSASHQDLTERNYWDLAALWDITSKATFRVGMNNVLDSQPPIAGNNAGPSNFGNGNVFPGGYDYLGRYYFAGVQIAM